LCRSAFEDFTGTYQSPNYASSIGSSGVTAFTVLTCSSKQFVTLGASAMSIAGFQFTVNVDSSLGSKSTLISLQSGDL